MGGFPAKLIGTIDSDTKTIGPRSLEKYLGLTVGKISFVGSESFDMGFGGSYETSTNIGVLEINSNGDFYLSVAKGKNIVIYHGDPIRTYHSTFVQDHVFIDESD